MGLLSALPPVTRAPAWSAAKLAMDSTWDGSATRLISSPAGVLPATSNTASAGPPAAARTRAATPWPYSTGIALISRRLSWLAWLAEAITLAPRATAICAATAPTPPAPPSTKIVSPALTPSRRRPRSLVSPATPAAAATAQPVGGGLAAQASSAAYSAWVSWPRPNTSSPRGDPGDPLTDLVHHAGGVVSEITRTGQGQHVLHDACSLSCADYGSSRAARTTMKTTGVSRSACSPWCPAPGQRLGPARTSWLAPSVSSSRRRASARSSAEIAGDLAGRGFAGPGQKRIRPWTLASGAT